MTAPSVISSRRWCGDPDLVEGRQDRLGEGLVEEFEGRHVERDALDLAVFEPGLAFDQCLFEQRAPDATDDPALFGERDEISGADLRAAAVGPSRERLDRLDIAALEVDDRLIGKVDPAILQRAAKLGLHPLAILVGVEEARLEFDDLALGLLLALVECKVGEALEVDAIVAMGRANGEAERAAGVDRHAVDRHLALEHLAEAVRHLGNGGGVRPFDNDREFVSADAGDEVPVAGHAAQPRGKLDQEAVAVTMAEGVVDQLEAVEVDEQQPHRAPRQCAGRERLLETLRIAQPVGDAGQIVGRADLDRRHAGVVELQGARRDALLQFGIELNQALVGGEEFEALALEQALGLVPRGMLPLDAPAQAFAAVVDLKRTVALEARIKRYDGLRTGHAPPCRP